MTLIALYVDDLLIAGNNVPEMQRVKAEFSKRFKMKDLGDATEFLGLRIARDRNKRTLHLSQTSYIDKVLERFRMSDAKPCATPMEVSKPTLESLDDPPAEVPYREAVGSLIWLMICTRPDIGYAVGYLSQHCEKPLTSHWNAVKRVLRYVKGTRTAGLSFSSGPSLHPVGYCDSDWAGCRATRKSTEGYVFLVGGGAVSWRSKKQKVVATSSCEAEYVASFSATKECIWLSRLFAEILGKSNIPPVTVHIDNQGAIDTAKGSAINHRNKHIDIRYHFVRDAVRDLQINLKYCPREFQVADMLTKPLLRVAHQRTSKMMGLCEPNAQVAVVEGEC